MEDNFRIRPITEILDYIDVKKSVKLDSFTMAKIYLGSNGFYYLLPAVGSRGIEASKQEVIDSMLETKHIPIEEDGNNFFSKNGELIADLSGNAHKIILPFFQRHNIQIDLAEVSFDVNQFDSIVNKVKGEKRYEEFCFFIGILIGEKLRIEYNAIWVLEKRYGYNPYFVPTLYSEKNKTAYDPWYWLSRSLFSNQKFSFSKAYQQVSKIPN